jgi:hypothetical protein
MFASVEEPPLSAIFIAHPSALMASCSKQMNTTTSTVRPSLPKMRTLQLPFYQKVIQLKRNALEIVSRSMRSGTGTIVQKFQQNVIPRQLLAKCASYKFVECTQYDTFWENGLKWIDKEVGVPSRWRGKNMMGACLQEAAKHYKRLYSHTVSPKATR